MTSDDAARVEALVRFPDMHPGPVLQLSGDSEILLANQAARTVLGDDLIGKPWADLCLDASSERWEEIKKSPNATTIEHRIDGRDYAFAHRLDGETGIVFVFGSDVTELKQRDIEVREMARFPDMNPGPVVRVSSDGDVLMANRAAAEILGANLVGSNWLSQCRVIDDSLWQSILESREPVQVEYSAGDRDFVLLHRSDPESGLVFVFGSDITELNNARKTIAEVARFPDMNPGPVLRLDIEATVLISNKASKKLFGDELDGRCWYETLETLTEADWNSILANHDEPQTIESRVEGRDYLFVHRYDQVTQLVFVYGTDISEQRRLEEEIRQAEKMSALGKLSAGLAHELNNPAAAAARAADQIYSAMERLKEATAELSMAGLDKQSWDALERWEATVQDRKSTDTTISALEQNDREEEIIEWLESMSFPAPWEAGPVFASAGVELSDLEILSDAIPGDAIIPVLIMECRLLTAFDLADVLASSAKSISSLVGAVKSYSYMDRAPVQNADIHKGIEDTITILNHKLKNGIAVIRDYDPSIPKLEINGSELNQVWTNIIDNAADAMNGGGTLTIRTRLADGTLQVELQDDGPGIPDEIQGKIFDPFYTTKGVGTGTGLGLDVVRRIVVERSGGEIDVESKPGQTIFTVRIPVQQSD